METVQYGFKITNIMLQYCHHHKLHLLYTTFKILLYLSASKFILIWMVPTSEIFIK